MRMLRPLLVAGLLAAGLVAAFAIQPGTTGTEKRYQQQGLRSGVLIQKNNTATASGAQPALATLNAAGSGVITTASIATPADSDYTLTLTNDMIAAADVVLATVNLGSATVGKPYVRTVTPAAGSVTIVVGNASTGTTLDGTLQIRFLVVKQSVNGAD